MTARQEQKQEQLEKGAEQLKDAPPAPEQAAEVDLYLGLVPGRIVSYTPFSWDRPPYPPSLNEPWAAIVTAVNRDERGIPTGSVTLHVFPPVRSPVGEDPVQRRDLVPHNPDGEPNSWRWTVSSAV